MNIKCGLEFVFEQKDPVGRLSSFGGFITERRFCDIIKNKIQKNKSL